MRYSGSSGIRMTRFTFCQTTCVNSREHGFNWARESICRPLTSLKTIQDCSIEKKFQSLARNFCEFLQNSGEITRTVNSLDERKSRDFSEVLADTDISFDSTWSEIDEIVTTNRVFHEMERWKFAVRTRKYYLEIVFSALLQLLIMYKQISLRFKSVNILFNDSRIFRWVWSNWPDTVNSKTGSAKNVLKILTISRRFSIMYDAFQWKSICRRISFWAMSRIF